MKDRKTAEIKKSVLIPLGLVLLLLIGLAIAGAGKLQRQHIDDDMRENIKGVEHLFQILLEEEAVLIGSLIESYTDNKSLQTAYLAKDRDALLQASITLYQEIQAKYNITHFYFHTPEKSCFLRVHNPLRHGDSIKRFTMDMAVLDGRPVSGIELGPFGTFTLRVVHPWWVGGKLIGYIELGKEVEHITAKLKRILGLELFWFIDKSFLNRKKWAEGVASMGRTGSWDQFSLCVLTSKTMESVPIEINDDRMVAHDTGETALFNAKLGQPTFVGGSVDLLDVAARKVGHIFILKDVSEELSSLRSFYVIFISIGLGLGSLLMVLFGNHLGRLEKKLLRARNSLASKHAELIELFQQVERAKRQWEQTMDCIGEMVLLVDGQGRIIRCNRAVLEFTGKADAEIMGEIVADILPQLEIDPRAFPTGGEEVFDRESGRWFALDSYPFTSVDDDTTSGQVVTIKDITRLKEIANELVLKNKEIDENGAKLKRAFDELSRLIKRVSVEEDFSVRFENPDLGLCQEIRACAKDDCPCYGETPQRCWQIVGSYSRGASCDYVRDGKKDCVDCRVYGEATSTPGLMLGEEFNNMMSILETKNRELLDAYEQLKLTQSQVLQQEKMASIGQLAAGVAHEINNPMGFISSNLRTLQKYVGRLVEFMAAQTEVLTTLQALDRVAAVRKSLKLDYIIDDTRDLISESLDGADRVKRIVQNLKSFARVDQAEEKMADLNECLATTLNIVWNELKYKATVIKEYGELPLTLCNPQHLNQVFMNLLVNAAQAIEKQGEITIRSWEDDGWIKVAIGDTGCGIPADNLNKIFEPFFTSKEVGKGTGLGLSICYDLVKKHAGEIIVESEEGQGTTFTVVVPVQEKEE